MANGDSEQDNSDYGSTSSRGSSSGSSWKNSRGAKALGSAGRGVSAAGQSLMDSSRDEAASSIHAVSYKRGGKVRSTGPANLHKNERVIPANKVKRVEKMMRKSKMRLTNKRRSSGRR